MQDRLKIVFMALVKAGLWKRIPQDELHYFPLSDEDWQVIYNNAIAQTVDVLVYEGILCLPTNLLPPKQAILKWTARVDRVERYNKKMQATLVHLFNLVGDVADKIVLLKGFGLAANYINPLGRISGDIDLYFENKESLIQFKDILEKKNIKINIGDHNSIYFQFKGFEFEGHTQMLDIFNPFVKSKVDRLIKNESQQYIKLDLGGAKLRTPSYLLTQIQANAHILKHYLGFGIGLRQFCDVARLCAVRPEKFDGLYLQKWYKDLGILKWMNVVHHFLVAELGLEQKYLPFSLMENESSKWLLADVLATGNFGFHDIRFQDSQARIEERNESRSEISKRVLPHILKGLKYSPSETFWYPIMKAISKINR